ncbi:ABC transporter substrate-binding protein, partial [Acinetobacter baumannii]
TTLEPPLGNGAYRIIKVDPGKQVVLERVKDYWAADLPVNRGRYNFDILQYDYGYRDLTVWLEAFKAGQFDIKTENVSKNWATAYDIPAVAAGQ